MPFTFQDLFKKKIQFQLVFHTGSVLLQNLYVSVLSNIASRCNFQISRPSFRHLLRIKWKIYCRHCRLKLIKIRNDASQLSLDFVGRGRGSGRGSGSGSASGSARTKSTHTHTLRARTTIWPWLIRGCSCPFFKDREGSRYCQAAAARATCTAGPLIMLPLFFHTVSQAARQMLNNRCKLGAGKSQRKKERERETFVNKCVWVCSACV